MSSGMDCVHKARLPTRKDGGVCSTQTDVYWKLADTHVRWSSPSRTEQKERGKPTTQSTAKADSEWNFEKFWKAIDGDLQRVRSKIEHPSAHSKRPQTLKSAEEQRTELYSQWSPVWLHPCSRSVSSKCCIAIAAMGRQIETNKHCS